MIRFQQSQRPILAASAEIDKDGGPTQPVKLLEHPSHKEEKLYLHETLQRIQEFLRSHQVVIGCGYVGLHRIPDTNVYSWADTLAGDLYYKRTSRHSQGKLLLKRNFKIQEHDSRRSTTSSWILEPVMHFENHTENGQESG